MNQPIEQCLCCGGLELVPFADLGAQPLANDFQPAGVNDEVYPLALNVCPNCFHSQLTYCVDRDRIFRSYAYVSGTTATLDRYFRWFAEHVSDRQPKKGKVLDIGCNDGSQLAQFASLGWDTAGVDPAEDIPVKPQARARLFRGFWSPEAARALAGGFDAVVAQNVLAHTPDPAQFLRLCHEVLAPSGRVYLQTSQANMIERRQFDTVYHEHISFFSMRSLEALAERCGFRVLRAERVAIHGESYLFELAATALEEGDGVAELLRDETTNGRYSLASYHSFAADLQARVEALLSVVNRLRKAGYRVVGYGAAAKGNTFLNYADLPLEFLVDDNPRKHGLVTPGKQIPVFPPEHLASVTEPMVIVALAWNFFEEIAERVWHMRGNRGDILLRYFPEIEEYPFKERGAK